MDSRSTFLRQLSGLMEGRRLEGERTIRNVRGPLEGEGEENPPSLAFVRDRPHICSSSHPKSAQEKLLSVEALVTVLKPTQVGETSSLRRSGEHWLRNSAK